jgi:copper chaperone CopZ
MDKIQIFKVEGMSCKNCKAHVEREIMEINEIEDFNVDLATGELSVSGYNFTTDQIKNAVEKAGYIFKGAVEKD